MALKGRGWHDCAAFIIALAEIWNLIRVSLNLILVDPFCLTSLRESYFWN